MKDWDRCDATIYIEGAATHSNANSGSGITATIGLPSDHRVHRQCTTQAGRWCSSIQVEEKAVRTALKLIQEDVSLHTVRIVSDSMSTLQRIRNVYPPHQFANSDERDILDTLFWLTERGCHLTSTWCPNHSGVRGNE